MSLVQFAPLQSIENTQARDRNNKEIYLVAWILRQLLVPDLVFPVIEQAHFYNNQISTVDRYSVIRATNSPATCLIAEPIIVSSRSRHPIRTVTFNIKSKDQGFAAYPGGGSWTWFTAGILKCGSSTIVDEREIVRNTTSSTDFSEHAISWSATSGDDEEASWVRSLQQGDRIVIRGHAKHRGWVNFVNFVQVTVSKAVIIR